jgi:hypothetical protein
MMLAEVVAPDLQDSGENHGGFQTLLPAMLQPLVEHQTKTTSVSQGK